MRDARPGAGGARREAALADLGQVVWVGASDPDDRPPPAVRGHCGRISGKLSRDVPQKIFEQNQDRFEHRYQRGLVRDPELEARP